MFRKATMIIPGALAGAMLVGISTGVAQDSPQRGWGPGWDMLHMLQGHWRMPFWGGWWGESDIIDRIDGRLAYVRAELDITQEQTAAWEAFAVAMRDSAETHNAMIKAMRDDGDDDDDYWEKPLPERLEIHVTLMEARLAQLKVLKEAADQLYSVLSDEQKKIGNEILMPMMGGPGHGGMWRWMIPG